MLKRILRSLVVIGLLAGLGLAHNNNNNHHHKLPQPEVLTADATPEQLRTEVLAVHDILCADIEYAAQILTQTGTLAKAIPVVMEITGLQPFDIKMQEATVCASDISEMSFEELRANNRQAVWLLHVHITAMTEVITGQ